MTKWVPVLLATAFSLSGLACEEQNHGPAVMVDASPVAAASEPSGWRTWKKQNQPVFRGQFSVSSDPCVLREPNGYRMFYTGLDPDAGRTVLCSAVSKDGLAWREVETGTKLKGLVLNGKPGAWNENMESAFVVEWQGQHLLYYSGYRDVGTVAKGFPAALGIATSKDKRTFVAVSPGPALEPTEGGRDCDAIYSAVVVLDGKKLVMVYVGHAYSNKNGQLGVFLLGATSDDGVHWKKNKDVVLAGSEKLPWTKDGVAEPALLHGPDGYWYLFFTGLKDEERVIGVARGRSPFGPWDLNPTPIIVPTASGRAFDDHQVLAPAVLLEEGRVRMWYLGANKEGSLVCGYAEAAWPLYVTPGPATTQHGKS